MDLFHTAPAPFEPLASRLRPRNLDEFVGQEHILGPGRLLRRAIEADQCSSLIFYGPPGTGKTTLAQVIAASTRGRFLALNAVLSGVKEIREIIEKAQEFRGLQGKKTILFVDEVHRWNKAQQDALLPWVENGTFILIGATTENPYFEVNAALVSRSRIFQLRALDSQAMVKILDMALKDPVRGYGKFQVEMDPQAVEHLVKTAAGDARSLLGALELAVQTSVPKFPPAEGTKIFISLETAEESIQKKVVLYDKDGDYHYDTISAFIKSIRGSDPDAALFWLARMVRGGEDPKFILRRMMISASEDVGLADPQALVQVTAAVAAFQQVGLPEGQYHLAQAALYLATAPKSNSTMGYFEALKSLESQSPGGVPAHLKDPSRDGAAFGHGQGYQYPHAFKDHWVAQQYLPSGLRDKIFYKPSSQGYEGQIQDKILSRREAVLGLEHLDENREVYSFSKTDQVWQNRLDQGAKEALDRARSRLLETLGLQRHSRVWILKDPTGVLLFEALRRCPEGQTWVSGTPEQIQRWQDYLQFLPQLQAPEFLPFPFELTPADRGPGYPIEALLALGAWDSPEEFKTQAPAWARRLESGGQLGLLQNLPQEGQRLAQLLAPGTLSDEDRRRLETTETTLLTQAKTWDWEAWDPEILPGGTWTLEKVTAPAPLVLTPDLLGKWLDPHRPHSLGQTLVQDHGEETYQRIRRSLELRLGGKEVPWHRTFGLAVWKKP